MIIIQGNTEVKFGKIQGDGGKNIFHYFLYFILFRVVCVNQKAAGHLHIRGWINRR